MQVDAVDKSLLPGLGRFPGGGHGNPLQYSCLGNLMDRGAWQATVHWVTESDTTEVTSHTCIRVLFREFPSGSDSICLQCRRPRFNHWVGKILWRQERLPTPIFLPGEFHGQKRLVSYSPWGRKESDTTEQQTHTHRHTHTCYSRVS